MRRAALGLVLLTLALGAAPAAASKVTIGALDPRPGSHGSGPPWSHDGYPNSACDIIGGIYVPGRIGQPSLAAPGWTVPAGGGILTSWSTSGQSPGSRFRLVVTRFNPDGRSVAIEVRSALETIPSAGVVTFRTHLQVTAGDQISLDAHYLRDLTDDCYYPGVRYGFVFITGDTPQSDADSPFIIGNGYPTRRVNVRATLNQGTSAVTAPWPGGGRSCVVPSVRGMTVRRAEHLIAREHCAVGRVAGRSPRVIRQQPRPSTVLPAGSRVDLVLRG